MRRAFAPAQSCIGASPLTAIDGKIRAAHWAGYSRRPARLPMTIRGHEIDAACKCALLTTDTDT